MKICVYGCGYVGLSFAAVLSEIGHSVYCIDTNDYRLKNIQKGVLDFYEPDLSKIVLKNISDKKLSLYQKHDIELGTDIYVIAVGSEVNDKGEVVSSNVNEILSNIVSSITKYSIILILSEVPIGTTKSLIKEYKNKTTIDFDIVYNPVFAREGSTYSDFKNPQRIVLGTESKKALKVLKELYEPIKSKIIATDETSAELAKLANDTFLSVKVSYINEIANIASMCDADISSIQKILSADKRIGKNFLNAGIGFGGRNLKKSLNMLINYAEKKKTNLNIIKSARITNENQKRIFLSQILKHYNYNIENKMFCIWGLSFKPNSNNVIDAPSNTIIDTLLRYGANVRTYDPCAVKDDIKQYKTKEEALLSSEALIILTDWEEFNKPDFNYIAKTLSDKVIFDARNMYIDMDLSKYGLKYYCIGKSNE